MLRYRHLANGLFASLLCSCSSPTVDLGDGFGWNGSEGLHMPWALGTDAVLTSYLDPKLARKADKIEVESSDEGVFKITNVEFGDSNLWIDGTAVSEGESTVRVTKGSRELGSAKVEVSAISNAGLVPAAAALDPTEEETTLYEKPRVIVNGRAYFRVQFYKDTTPVFGATIVEVDAANSLDLQADNSYLEVEGQWINVRPAKKGVFPVTLQVNGEDVGNLEIEVVGRNEVDKLTLVAKESRVAVDEQSMRLVLRSFDADGRPLFGAPVIWSVDGDDPDERTNEIYTYAYDPNSVNLVEVELGDLRASETIHGYAVSECGCSNGAPVSGWLFAMALGFSRVRRRETGSAQTPRP